MSSTINIIQYCQDERGIVTITLNNERKSTNIIDETFILSLEKCIDEIKLKIENIKGIIFTSGKSSFLAGADIDSIFSHNDPKIFFYGAEKLKSIFRKIETIGKPVVSAINGTALGGGFELCLATHYRVCLNNKSIQLGLPEVQLGLLPGGGGITRMIRLIGLLASLPYLTEGKKVNPEQALADGLIHDLANTQDELIQKAKDYIFKNPNSKANWDIDGYKMPGGLPTNPKVAQMLPIGPAMLAQKTYNNYPAPNAIMSAAVEGALVDFDTASRIESRYFAYLASSKVAKNMITVFWKQLNLINAGNSRPKSIQENYKVSKVGIIGAGMMGSGIAYASAKAGIETILKDVTVEAANKGKLYSELIVKKGIHRGKISQENGDNLLNLIKSTAFIEDLKTCDLIIEAVYENRALKATVTQEVESQINENTVVASNTSTLPISGLANASIRPQNFIGLHFFSPVDKMPLVEIICGKKTNDETLAKAFDFVKQIGKTPIVVNDSRGFYTSRVFATYVMEGMAMLAEGQHPRSIEVAGLQSGMPVGPLALSDEVSLGLIDHIRKQTIEDMKAEGKAIPEHKAYEVVNIMVNEVKRLGKASGAGFYEYPKNGDKKYLWMEISKFFTPQEQMLQQEMIDRMLYVQAIETVRCLEEGVLRNVADANIGSVFGWGFAPFKGGTLQFINDVGINDFIKQANILENKYGKRFSIPKILIKMQENNEIF